MKIAWRNWGFQMRVPPPPNLMSPRYRAVCREKMALLVPIVLGWWQALPADKKDLFAGLKVGHESSIGINAWHYPNGNDLLSRPEAAHPKTGFDPNNVPSRGQVQLSLQAARPGVPRDKLFTHAGGFRDGELLYRSALNPHASPGWTVYRHAEDPRKDVGIQEALKASDAPDWGAVEWFYHGQKQTPAWQAALQNTFADPRCRLLCLYNWESIRDSPPILQAIRNTLAGAARP